MKILTINHPITDERVTNRANFADAEALFDFDVVIIQPMPVRFLLKDTKKFYDTAHGIIIDANDYANITTQWQRRSNEIKTFLENNGMLIVILTPVDVGIHAHADEKKVDNYDWLPSSGWLPYSSFSLFVSKGDGDGCDITNNSNPFAEYIKQGKIKWQAYIDYFDGLNVFAIIKGKVIGATVNLENGKLVFLPTLQKRNDEVLLSCIENSFETYSETPPPDWINEFILPKEKEGEQDIEKIQQQLEEIKEREKKAKDKLREITNFKKLLYEKGKCQLEPVVRNAFRLLGFTVYEDYKPEPSSNIEIDAMIECEYGKAIVEIKGTEKSVILNHFSQLRTKTEDDLRITNELKESILVGNGFKTCKHPKDRIGGAIFGQHVKESAKRQSVTLINTVDLYEVVRSILDGEEIDKGKLQQKILRSKGICKFKEFIKEK